MTKRVFKPFADHLADRIAEQDRIVAARRILFASKDVGSHHATRVRVRAPQGSAFDGRNGLVARLAENTVFVRFPSGLTLPFGRGELEVLS